MLNTTFTKLREADACPAGYRKLAKYLGGVTKYGKYTPIPIKTIIESNGMNDALWSLRATIEDSENLLIEFTCRCAEHVLHFYEDKYPDDKRPRQAIAAARARITDKSSAAWAAAWSASAAAWSASAAAWSASAAAWAAAWSASAAASAAARDAASAAARAARDAAWAARAAAGDAAWAAAGDAAWDAAWAAEKEWQKQQLIALLEAHKC